MSRALEISENVRDGVHVLTLVGRLDTNTAYMLEGTVRRIFAEDSAAHVVLDLKLCGFVSSAGIRVIVATQKRATAGGSLRMRNVSKSVRDVFAATGVDSILSFE